MINSNRLLWRIGCLGVASGVVVKGMAYHNNNLTKD